MALVGLRTLLAACVGGIGLAFTLGTAVLLEGEAEKRMRDLIGTQLREHARQVADKLDRGMAERYRDVLVAASLDTLRSPATSTAERRAVLDRLKQTFPAYAWIGLIRPEGIVAAATDGILEGVDVNKRTWWKQALDHPYVGDVHDAVILADLLYPNHPLPPRFLDFAAPIRADDGTVVGVVAAHLSWDWAAEVRNSVLDGVGGGQRIEGMILAKDGTVILGPRPLAGKNLDALLAGQTEAAGTVKFDAMNFATISFDGEEYLTSIVPTSRHGDYPGLGWRVAVRSPMAVAMQPVREFRNAVLIGGAILSAAAVLLGYLLAGWIAGPLRALSHAVGERRQGRAAALPATGPFHEVATLADAVRSYLDELAFQAEQLRASLDEKERLLSEKTTLINEIHHRVKNNLQIILSLMLIETRRLGKEPGVSGAERMKALAARVSAMGRLHEQLYESQDLAHVDLAHQLEVLCRNLADIHRGSGIVVRVEAAPVRSRLETAMPIGLLVNELVVNAFKHAFPDGRSGTVVVRLRDAGDTVVLEVADDGIGCGGEVPAGGIGSTLIDALTRQIEADLEYRTDHGCIAVIALPRDRIQPGSGSEGGPEKIVSLPQPQCYGAAGTQQFQRYGNG